MTENGHAESQRNYSFCIIEDGRTAVRPYKKERGMCRHMPPRGSRTATAVKKFPAIILSI